MSEVLIGLVGDVLVNRDNPAEVFSDVREILNVPQILFANLEGAHTFGADPKPRSLSQLSAPGSDLLVYPEVGFDVLSLANNHTLDAGPTAMLETRSRLRAQGVRTCGAGADLADAREPAIAEADGVRVAFLAYTSTFPLGSEASSDRPGLAPMRAYNFWREPLPTYHLPGIAPLITTVPDETDLAHLVEDIHQARGRADLVVVSFHWGDHTRPFHLTDHEKRTARSCIDHGADMVVGHHHHALRAMEWYKGKPIMYGLGHFVFDARYGLTDEEWKQKLLELDPTDYFQRTPFTAGPREGWPLLPMHEDTRMTVFAWATARRNGISDIGFLPCRLTPDGLVHPLRLGSPESDEVVRYVERCHATQGLKSRIVSDGSRELAGHPTLRVAPG